MRFLIVVAVLISAALAVPPTWYNGPCGASKYADAGDMNLPPGYRMIVGGIEAREHEFPWQVSLRRGLTSSHFCGGSIINDRWIISATHCLRGESPSDISVVVGDHTRNAPDSANPARQTIDAEAIFVHEDYGPIRLVNDISLIKLAQPIQLSEDVQPVCPPDAAVNYQYRKSVCSGWGSEQSGGSCCPETLRYVSLNVTTNAFCDAEYPNNAVTEDMICASDNSGGNSRDSCQGDSGGPLVVKESDGTFRLIGIVSWGIGCASGYPGVYSRVQYFEDWILNIINNN